jgi:valyl-tRNA synthetase
MILFSTFLVGQIPFHTALIHGMLRDRQGRKFSKSLDNGINPLEVIEQYGTDALRMSLTIGVAPGQDMNFDLQKVKAYSKFANKIWNASRFVMENMDGYDFTSQPELNEQQQLWMRELGGLVTEVTMDIDNYRLYLAGEKLYHYFWHTFADIIIEGSKEALYGDDADAKAAAQHLIYTILTTSLKLLHPFMPFITEEIWQSLPHRDGRDMLMVTSWPEA